LRFNDRKFAREYDIRLARENYPGELYSHVKDRLEGSTFVLDVGAGSGFLAVPLAREGKKITAIEPSAEMIEILKEKITPDISGSISIDHTDWESWSGPFSEALICIHSLYPMKDADMALSLMKKRSGLSLVAVRTHEGRKTLSDVIRKKILPGHTTPDYPEIIRRRLDQIGAPYTETLITETKRIPIEDVDAEADFHSLQLFKDRGHASQIKLIITDSSEKTGHGLVFTASHRDILFEF